MLRSPEIISEHYDGRVGLYCRHIRTSADVRREFGVPASLWSVRPQPTLYGMVTGSTKAEAVSKYLAKHQVSAAA